MSYIFVDVLITEKAQKNLSIRGNKKIRIAGTGKCS